jgi:hypothetical protein
MRFSEDAKTESRIFFANFQNLRIGYALTALDYNNCKIYMDNSRFPCKAASSVSALGCGWVSASPPNA